MPQSIFSNAIIATLGRAITLSCGIAATALTARILGASGLGIYSLVITVGTILQLASDFGLYLTASRELGVSEGKPTEKLANIASLRLALLGIVFIAGSIGFFSAPSLRGFFHLFLVIAGGLIFQSASQLLMSVFQAYGYIWRATVGDVVGRVVQVAILGIVLLFANHSSAIMWVAAAFTGGLGISLLIHIVLVPNKRLLIVQYSWPMWKHIIHSSWPIALMLLLNALYFRIDTVLLSFWRSTEEVGFYSLAYKVIENGLFFPAMIGGLLLPAITSALARRDTASAQQLVSQGLLLSLSGAGIVVAVLMAFPADVMILLGGVEFTPASPLLRILALALGSMFIGNIFGFALIALEKQKALAGLYGILAALTVIANILLIPLFGALAAAWVTVVVEVLATMCAAFMVRKHIQWSIPHTKSIALICISCVAVVIPLLLLTNQPLGVRLLAALGIYIVFTHVSKVWSKNSLPILHGNTIV